MKKLFFFVIAALHISLTGIAQVSESINYQAVARNNAGAALANQTIKVRFTISRNAVSQYSETRQVTTNVLGLFNVQIGSAGALSTTGSFTAIDWKNNTPNMQLKIELDINNTNVFTDMGFQAFSSVPFAMAAKTAVDAENTLKLAGRPLDLVTTPAVGNRLSWNGSSWTPVKKDALIKVAGQIPQIGVISGHPWQWVGPTATVTVTGTETIVANFTAVIGHTSAQQNGYFDVSVCYRNVNNGSIVNFDGPDGQQSIYLLTSKSIVPLVNSIVLPAGTYQIGMAIRHVPSPGSGTPTLDWNDIITGLIEVRY